MILALDIGNTNILAAVFQENSIQAKFRISTKPLRTSDEYLILFSQFFSHYELNSDDISDVIVSSVVPQLDFEIKRFLKNFTGHKPRFVADYINELGVNVLLKRPAELGSDRLVNAIAAYHEYKQASIIIDFGTATTFDVINDDGDYLGGVISTGVNLSLEALYNYAAKLPKVEVARPDKVIGDSTKSAMQSGIFFGYKGMVEGIIEQIKLENPLDYKVIATGGLAPLFADAIEEIDSVEEDLTINGLKIIYDKIRNINV